MFTYNRFWHFWFRLDNRHYLRILAVAIVAAFVGGFLLFPVFAPTFLGILTLIAVPSMVVAVTIRAFNFLSNYFFNKQVQTLKQLKREVDATKPNPEDVVYNSQLDQHINRRIVCPKEILQGQTIKYQVASSTDLKTSINAPLIAEQNKPLALRQRGPIGASRNLGFVSQNEDSESNNADIDQDNKTDSVFMKEAAVMDALSEVAAREMAELMGFEGLIPNSNVTGMQAFERKIATPEAEAELTPGELLSNNLLPRPPTPITPRPEPLEVGDLSMISKNAIDRGLRYMTHRLIAPGKSEGVRRVFEKLIFNIKTAGYRRLLQQGTLSELLFVSNSVPDSKDGMTFFQELMGGIDAKLAESRALLDSIDQFSFEQHFLLHLLLGSQDANISNTLFTTENLADGTQKTALHSIDHERIMPDDNYNITKKIPIQNGQPPAVEREIENVFPIRLWLAGLPHAIIPFSKLTILKTLRCFDSNRLLAYHQQKKLFSPAAVGAQIERIQLIRAAFEAELKKPTITLTPRALFLKFVSNHPSYDFLKNRMDLSDFSTFSLLGQVPEDADWSVLRHPQQTLPMWGKLFEHAKHEVDVKRDPALANAKRPFSDESFNSPYAPRLMFFSMAAAQKAAENDVKTKDGYAEIARMPAGRGR
jgi:hypothetical protein